jgi:hypothetical protein
VEPAEQELEAVTGGEQVHTLSFTQAAPILHTGSPAGHPRCDPAPPEPAAERIEGKTIRALPGELLETGFERGDVTHQRGELAYFQRALTVFGEAIGQAPCAA